MAKIIKHPFNIIDWIFLGLVALIILFIAVCYFRPAEDVSAKKIAATIRVSNNVSEILPEAQKMGLTYLNSVNRPVEIKDVKKVTEGGKEILYITVSGPGSTEDNRYVINGQRILIGQKAELHGKFWAQGIITEVKYAD